MAFSVATPMSPAIVGLPLAPVASLRVPRGRWLFLTGVLVAEVLALSWRFDTKALTANIRGWEGVARTMHYLPQLALAVAVGMVVFGGARWANEIRRLVNEERGARVPWWVFLGGHLAAMAVFAWLTQELFEGSAGAGEGRWAWWLAWGLAGIAGAVLWLGSILPWSAWQWVMRRGAGTIGLAVGVSVAAVGLGSLTADFWRPLGRWTLWAVQGMVIVLFGEGASCDVVRSRLQTDRFWIEVSPQCSGYEGIGLIWAFLAVFCWYYRRELRFPQAWLLFPLGTAIIWVANVLRITALFTLGQWRPDIALAGFHSQAGWLSFSAVSLGLLAASRRWRFFTKTAAISPAPGDRSSAAFLAPLFVLLAGTMVTQAFSAGFDQLYPLRILATSWALWMFRHEYGRWTWSWSWTAIGIGVAVFGIWILLEPAAPSSNAESPWSLEAGLGDVGALVWIGFRLFGSIVVVPLAEEIAFRGYLVRRLISADFREVKPGQFTWFSFLVSSALFGLLHSRWEAALVAGLLFALALYRRGRLSDAVMAHAVANALIAAHVLTTGQWSVWS
jgi:exosortase E/protease (VPEID-CTERM system)